MKPSRITAGLGVVLIAVAILMFVKGAGTGAFIPLLVGGSLIYLAINKGRIATLVFGHTCILVGAYLVAWGIQLPAISNQTALHIVGRPLFWGIFSIMGGICAIFHGFCRCVTHQVDQFENPVQPK
jgi:hypothetical protein